MTLIPHYIIILTLGRYTMDGGGLVTGCVFKTFFATGWTLDVENFYFVLSTLGQVVRMNGYVHPFLMQRLG